MASGIAHTVILFSNRTILSYGYNNKKQIEIEKEIALKNDTLEKPNHKWRLFQP